MTCDEAMRLLLLADAGEASPREREALAAHLDDCTACRAEADEVRTALGAYRTRRTVPAPAPDVRARLLAAAPRHAAPRGRILRLAAAGLAAAAAVLVAFALSQPTETLREAAHPDAPVPAAAAPLAQASASAEDAEDALLPDDAPISGALVAAAEDDLDNIEDLLGLALAPAGGTEGATAPTSTQQTTTSEEAILRTMDRFMEGMEQVGMAAYDA